MNQDAIIKTVPAPANATLPVKSEAINADIIEAIHSALPLSADQVRGLAPKFKRKNRTETAYAVWRFLRNVAVYTRDNNKAQNIRLPARFVHDTFKKKDSGDCKSFALFSAAIFRALNIPVRFVYAAYRPGAKIPAHVYTCIIDEAGRPVYVDGCYYKFNSEKKPTFKKIYDMEINYLAGTEETTQPVKLNNLVTSFKTLRETNPDKYKALCLAVERLAVVKSKAAGTYGLETINKLTAEQKKKRKEKIKKGGKKFIWGIAFINLAPIRGAFCSVVAMNINGLASNLKYVYEKRQTTTGQEWKKILKVWQNLGGLEKALMKAIQLGAKHKPLFLSKKRKAKYEERHKNLKGFAGADFIGDLQGDGINIAPAIAAAIIAAATGVIAAIIPMIMSALKKGGQKEAAADVQEQAVEIIDRSKRPGFAQEAAQGGEQATEPGEPGAPAGEEVEGINADYSSLVTALGEVAKVGITAAGNAIAKKSKKNPKTKKFLEDAAQAGDDYVTGAYLRKAGYTKAAKEFAASPVTKYAPYVAGGVGLLAVAYMALKKK